MDYEGKDDNNENGMNLEEQDQDREQDDDNNFVEESHIHIDFTDDLKIGSANNSNQLTIVEQQTSSDLNQSIEGTELTMNQSSSFSNLSDFNPYKVQSVRSTSNRGRYKNVFKIYQGQNSSSYNSVAKSLQTPARCSNPIGYNGNLGHNAKLLKHTMERHKYLTQEEQDFYENVGGFLGNGTIDDFDFSCQNKRELVVRVKQACEKHGFPVRLGQVRTENPQKIAFQFICSFRLPRMKRNILQKNNCTFYVRYKQNPNSLYFTLTDYDEVHNHPVRDILQFYISRYQFRLPNYRYGNYQV
ncbi:UNKNOWN [Stylonychia lemnae]|uniref:Uncharacterized protein n=1 Tax=Stylonychia lemnae TaxID=5949 RepID=A0A078BAE7_STYLE|nr:UNKNOWN [Stylonychia lemnae]|eukprot:CDW90503.1 UNKNOWN [Stylonychia lemnae]